MICLSYTFDQSRKTMSMIWEKESSDYYMICTLWKYCMSPANWGASLNHLLVGTRIDTEKIKKQYISCKKHWYPCALYIFELITSLIDDSIHSMYLFICLAYTAFEIMFSGSLLHILVTHDPEMKDHLSHHEKRKTERTTLQERTQSW